MYVRIAKSISQYIVAAIDKCQSILPTQPRSESRSEWSAKRETERSAKRSSERCAECSAQHFGSAIGQCHGTFLYFEEEKQ